MCAFCATVPPKIFLVLEEILCGAVAVLVALFVFWGIGEFGAQCGVVR